MKTTGHTGQDDWTKLTAKQQATAAMAVTMGMMSVEAYLDDQDPKLMVLSHEEDGVRFHAYFNQEGELVSDWF